MATTVAPGLETLRNALGEDITDVDEEVFSLFIEPCPSQNLGFIDPHSTTIEIEVNGHDFEFTQSPGLLSSARKSGTTGAVIWKISPLIAPWLASPSTLLWTAGFLHAGATVVELGCGISGLLGLCLAPLVDSYILTDQDYVMKRLRANIAANLGDASQPFLKRGKGSRATNTTSQPTAMPLDWETDEASNVLMVLGAGKQIDLLIACDCIYNDFLIEPFVNICVDLCKSSYGTKQTLLLVAQQLRSESVLGAWLGAMMRFFFVWRVPDQHLPQGLKSGTGYVAHLAMFRV